MNATKLLTLVELTAHLQKTLQNFLYAKQDRTMESAAQSRVDDEFKVLKSRGRLPEFSGLRIVGLKLGFELVLLKSLGFMLLG